jgi:hypothetical protein
MTWDDFLGSGTDATANSSVDSSVIDTVEGSDAASWGDTEEAIASANTTMGNSELGVASFDAAQGYDPSGDLTDAGIDYSNAYGEELSADGYSSAAGEDFSAADEFAAGLDSGN